MDLTWVEDLPADVTLPNKLAEPRFQTFFDDPRFDKDWQEDEHLYGDVVPIPFYPDDLPTLEPSPFGWTEDELQTAITLARSKLFRNTPRR